MKNLPVTAARDLAPANDESGIRSHEVARKPFFVVRSLWLRTGTIFGAVLIGSCLNYTPARNWDSGIPPVEHAASGEPVPSGGQPDPVAMLRSQSPAPLDRDKARALNATVPFSLPGQDRPAPFLIQVQDAAYNRALDCLASALLYEAGDDRTGQAAVAQVVLNRVRHPAFPHTVCGAVYQGAERSSGCQFTFTCDGALGRTPSAAAWQRARKTAASFLAGETYPAVGMATHYHTDWVHPYWSTELDKIARVGTHLFFRWQGPWGRQAAFKALYTGEESFQSKLQHLSPAHRQAASASANIPTSTDVVVSGSPDAETLTPRQGDHFILVDGGGDGGRLAFGGLETCADRTYCKVVGWDRRSAKYGSPETPAIRTVAFLYVRDKRTGVEIVLWDCLRFNRPTNAECISEKNRRWITFQGDLSRAS